MTKAELSEHAITLSIMRYLRSQADVYAFKIAGGVFQRCGLPDIVASVSGITVFLEVKSASGRVSPRQRAEHAKISAAGTLVAIVRSKTEAEAIIVHARRQAQQQNRKVLAL